MESKNSLDTYIISFDYPLSYFPFFLELKSLMYDMNFASWICPYISRHLLSLNPLLACCRRYSRG
ncbi:type V toxin-antitoxin system endoribonuclease antitoxin GhoS, partial [Escherichia coli]